MSQGSIKLHFSEFTASGFLAGCFAVLISYSAVDNLGWWEKAAVLCSIISIPLLILILGVISIYTKTGRNIETFEHFKLLEKVALVSALITFISYFASISYLGIIAFAISMLIFNFFLNSLMKALEA